MLEWPHGTSQTAQAPARPHRRADPGRNAPCPCGSGRKFKQCCGLAPQGRPAAPAPNAALDPLRMKATGALTPAGRLAGKFSPLQRVLRLGPSTAPAAPAARVETSQAGEESARAYLNLARGYIAAGRIGDAVQAWRQATRLDPANHAAWHDLGTALMKLGRVPDAIGAFRRAIVAKPDFAAAHHMLGIALEAQGNETLAVGALRRAVALSPKLADAHARIGTLLMSLSHRPEAIASLRRAAAVASQADIGRLSLAKALMAEERPEQAIAVLRRMLVRNPNHFDARKMLGDALSFAGEFEEAGREYQRAIDTGRQPVSAYHSLVMSRKLTEADRPLIDGMRRVLQRGGLPDFTVMILHFSLGKALDDLKQYGPAMEHFDAANRLRHRTSQARSRPARRAVRQHHAIASRRTISRAMPGSARLTRPRSDPRDAAFRDDADRADRLQPSGGGRRRRVAVLAGGRAAVGRRGHAQPDAWRTRGASPRTI